MLERADNLILPRPAPKRGRFAMTPLADAMFQLLIFFMLSSSLAPYSLLTIRSGPEPQQAGDAQSANVPDPDSAIIGANTALWTLEPGRVTIGGQTFAYAALPDLALALAANGDAEVIVILRQEARVQDLATVMEALTAAGISAVQIIQGSS